MVTGILIPLICIYFYWLTRKEWKQMRKEWENTVNVQEHSRLSGELQSITKQREKFYLGLYLDVYLLEIKHDGKSSVALRKIPTNSGQYQFENFLFQKVTLYGRWDEGVFLINRLIISS